MNPKKTISRFIASLMLITVISCTGDRHGYILFSDDFSGIRRGPLGSNSDAHTEYHYLPEAAPQGNWAISTFRYNLPPAWYIREVGGQHALVQDAVNPDRHWHPMVVAGDELWKDYTVRLNFKPGSTDRQCGLVFRYRNDRCYYFFGIGDNKILLKSVKDATGFRQPFERILAGADIDGELDGICSLSVTVKGDEIVACFNDLPPLEARDSTFAGGKIGLLADGPVTFFNIEVSSGRKSVGVFTREKSKRTSLEDSLQSANPGMKLWKRINTEGFGVGRNLRFGDLNNDGIIDVVIGQVIHHGPKDRNSELSCLTAMTFDGEILWQIGEPDPWRWSLTNDVAFQIHDLDNDGRNEVIYTMNQELIVAEASTGKIIHKVSTPLTPGGKPQPSAYNSFPHILGDCLFFCDLEGKGYDGNIILKDRYRYIWAYNASLDLLWKSECNTGHYPYAYDVDSDSRDEVIMGYTLFNDNGEKILNLDDILEDHADGVAIVKLKEDSDPVYLCAASDEGMFFSGVDGNIFKHHYIGHVQNPAVANFRDDLPGLETVSVNFWGNQGIIHLYDADGNIYHDFEPNQYGSMCLPLNWTGRSEEFFVLNANVDEGGAYDGHGRRVLLFPDDGHPDMCYAVLDITGDCRDEIVVWDPQEIWVYTQDDTITMMKLYNPERNPLYNYSNYQATVSLPGWEE